MNEPMRGTSVCGEGAAATATTYEATLKAVRALSEHRQQRGQKRNFRVVTVSREMPPPRLEMLPH